MRLAERPTGTPCWADIAVPDVERAKQFYGAMFGWDCRTDPREEAGGYTMCYLDDLPAAAITPIWTRPRAGLERVPGLGQRRRVRGGDHGERRPIVAQPMDVFDAGRLAMAIDPTGAAFGVWQKGTHRGIETEFAPGADQLGRARTATPTPRPRSLAPCSASTPSRFPGMDRYRMWQKDAVRAAA